MAYGLNGELVNDDRNLTRTTGLDLNGAPMSPIGGLDLNGAPASPLGLQPIQVPDIGFDSARQRIAAFAPPVPTPEPEQSQMYYSPSTGEMVINGFTFNERNASAALASREAAAQPQRQFQLPDTANDWRPLSQQEYSSYIDSIVNPGMGRRVSEAWEHAWRGWGDTNLGAVLAVDPDNEWATNARASLAQEFVDNAPFMLRLRDVESPGQAAEYVAQIVVQGVPWIVDTIAWMAAGAVVGGAASGGIGAPAGAISSFTAREAFRRATAEVIRQNLRRGAAAYAAAAESRGAAAVSREIVLREAAQTGAASADDVNRFFDFAERAYHAQRGGRTGMVAASALSNYETGVGEIRNAIADSGADPTTADSVANIWGMALPYAAVETLGDFIITQPVTRLLPNITQGASRVGNALRHGGLSVASEGIEEGTQYGIVQGAVANATNRPIDIEPYDLLENIIGGALGGAPFGVAAGALGPVTPRTAGITPPAASPAPVTGGATPPAPSPASPNWEDIEDNRTWAGLNVEDDPNFLFTGEPVTSPPPVTPAAATPLPQVYPAPVAPVTDENSPEFRAQYPELSAYLANKPPGYTQSPMDAARGVQPERAGPLPPTQLRSTVAPVITNPDGTKRIDETGITRVTDNAAWEAAVRAQREQQAQPSASPVTSPFTTGMTRPRPGVTQTTGMREHGIAWQEFGNFRSVSHSNLADADQGKRHGTEMYRRSVNEAHAQGRIFASDSNVSNAANGVYRTLEREGYNVVRGSRKDSPSVFVLPPGMQASYEELANRWNEQIDAATAEEKQREPTPRVGDDQLRGRTEEPTISIPNQNRLDALMGEAKQAVEDGTLDQFTDEKLNQLLQVTKRDLKLHNKFKAEKEARQAAKGGKARKRLKKALAKEDQGRFVSGDMIVTPAKPEAIEGDIIAPFTKEERATIDEFFDPGHAEAILDEMNPAVLYEDGKDMFDRGETVAQQLVAIKLIEIAAALGDKNARRYVGKEAPQSKVALTVEARTRADELLLNDKRGGNMSLYSAEERMLMEARMNEKYGDDHNKPVKYGEFDPVPDDIEAWVAEVTSLSDDEILARINELVREANQLARRKADVINFAEARERINKVKQDVQERSAEEVPAREQAGTREGVRGEDTGKREAPAKGTDQKGDEGVSRRVAESIKQQKEEAAAARIESGYKALLANSEGKDAAQRVRALIGVAKKGRNINRIKNPWTIIGGKPLTLDELRAIEAKFPKREEKPKAEPKEEPKTEPAEAKAAKKIARFGEDLLAVYKDSKADNNGLKAFKEYVLENVPETVAWLDTQDAKVRAGLANEARIALRDAPKQTPQAAYGSYQNKSLQRTRNNIKAARQKRLWKLIRAVASTSPRGLMLPTSWRTLVVANSNGEFKDEQQVERLTKNLLQADNEYGAAARKLFKREDVTPKQAMDKDDIGEILLEFGLTRNPEWQNIFDAFSVAELRKRPNPNDPPTRKEMDEMDARAKELADQVYARLKDNKTKQTQQFDMTDMSVKSGALSKQDLKTLISQVQKVVSEAIRFRTVHVFKDMDDFWKNANNVEITASNGAKHTLGRYVMRQAALLKLENPYLREFDDHTVATVYVRDYMTARAYVIPGYRALVAFSDYMGNRRDSLEVLEHEYIVHSGLSSIFPNSAERALFLHRVHTIPGIEAKRKALIARYPRYKNISFLDQIEEVIAFHAMEGPLALEKLLSAPEGVDPATKRTLWEDFKRLVSDWVNKLFNGFRVNEEEALDRIVAGLREYAMTGQTSDLNRAIDQYGAMSEERIFEIIRGVKDDEPKAAALGPVATPEETNELLYGGSDDPGRPYRPTGWTEQMVEILKSNESLLEKAQEVRQKGIATPIKEGWKKIGSTLETMINMADRSTLIEKLMEIMHNTIKVARRLMTKRQETRTYASKSKLFSKDGSTKEQRDAYNRMAIAATNSKMPKVSEEIVRQAPRLVVRGPNGIYTINEAVFNELLKKGTFTKEEFEAGIPQFTVDKNGNVTQVSVAKFDKKIIDAGYEMYEMESYHMARSMLETLEHALVMLQQMNETTVDRILRNNTFKPEDQAFVDEALRRMYKLYADIAFDPNAKTRGQRTKQKDKARQVLAELMRSFHTKDKVLDWTDSTRTRPAVIKGKNPRKNDAFKWRDLTNDEVKPYASQISWFLGADPATGLNRLERINGLGVDDNRQFKMLGAFQALLNAETQIMEHENSTIKTILGNYVEFTREGNWRVFINVIDAKTGERADISPEVFGLLPVTYPKTEREAKALQEQMQEELAGTFQMKNIDGETIKVKFDVGYGGAPGTSTLAEAPTIKEFLEVAEITGIKLSAEQMKKIANLIENAAERKRFGLQRTGTPGMDENILRNNDNTLTRRAWWAAKMSQAWMMEQIFADEKNVTGDWERLKQLQDNFDRANNATVRNEKEVYIAETALLRYANQLRYMSKTSTARSHVVINTTKGEQKFKIEPEAETHRKNAVALHESLERNDLELNLNDLLSKTGPLRMLAVVMQLGSIAAGIMNAFTLITHLPMVLTARHSETGYGEGFTWAEVTSEIMRAAGQVGKFWANYTDSAKVKQLLDDAKKGNNTTGLTIDELEFLYKETLEGLLMPQQTYSMTGGTESNISNLVARNLAETLLTPFSAIEASNRRVAALTTYRLAKARYIKAGVSADKLNDPKSDEYKQLMNDIERVVYQSQGDYANVNRPKAFRGDLAQYVLMYKMFPLMTTLMLYNLPKAQQAAFLGVLFLLGGLKAEPFAEDFMDLYDTLLQKLGFRHDSIELQLTRTLEKIMPGSSGWIMHGFIDNLAFGGTMSSRVAMGDILPMTGAFREGADLNREIEAAFGPAYAANVDSLEWAWLVADFAMQVAGVKDRTTDWRELIRKMPQAQIRGIGEGALMLADGQITDPRGRLVSDEVTPWSAFSRALGFYPLEATKANTAVRLDRMHIGYMRNVRARYVLAYAQAYRLGNQEDMDRIVGLVNEWNEAAREAGDDSMLIRNFRSAAVRAGRAASATTIERTSDAAPDYSLIDELAEILNADTESEE